MTVPVICTAVIIAGLFGMNIIMVRRPACLKKVRIAFFADTFVLLAAIAGAIVTHVRCMNKCAEKDLLLMKDSFLYFEKALLIFSAIVLIIYVVSMFLSPKLYFLHFGFYVAAQALFLIVTCIFSLLIRSDESALYRYTCLFGIFLSLSLSLCPAITNLRFLLSPATVKLLTEAENDKKEGRKKKKSLKKQ